MSMEATAAVRTERVKTKTAPSSSLNPPQCAKKKKNPLEIIYWCLALVSVIPAEQEELVKMLFDYWLG